LKAAHVKKERSEEEECREVQAVVQRHGEEAAAAAEGARLATQRAGQVRQRK
jgi:hypothetical protein